MTKDTGGTKTYILELKDGNIRKITIPSSWKLTFGHLVPPANKNTQDRYSGPSNGQWGVALRIYEGSKENLRAVMTDVVSIRDADISIIEKRTTVQRKATQKQTAKGAKDVVVEARVTEWVNPDSDEEDDTPNEFLTLTHKSDDDE